MKPTAALLLAIGITQIAGCAFGTRYVELSYPPAKQVEAGSSVAKVLAPGTRTHDVILLVRDARERTDSIGNVRESLGIKTASILTEDNVSTWVHDAVAVELGRLGYQAINHIAVSSDGAADHLTVNVRKIFCDIYAVYDGEVILQVELQRFGEEPVTMDVPAKVTSGLSFAASGKATGESLAQALQTAIRTMLRDFGFSDVANENRGP